MRAQLQMRADRTGSCSAGFALQKAEFRESGLMPKHWPLP
jgi:hypothetical protein